MSPVIIFLGAPGSGKGTQAAIIAKELGIPHLATGDMLRAMATSDSALGKELKEILEAGKLVSDELVNQIVLTNISSGESKNGCILDGYPRTVAQIEFLKDNCPQEIIVVYFAVEEQELVRRLTSRFACKECGRIYNKITAAPKIEGRCDACGSKEFTIRKDDEVAVVKVRLQEYYKLTVPLLDYCKANMTMITVNASESIDKITAKLLLAIKND